MRNFFFDMEICSKSTAVMTAESSPPKVTLNLPRRTFESLTSRSSPLKNV